MTDETQKAFNSIKLVFLAITLVFVITVAGFAKVLTDIQDSRQASCRQTYQGIREVFTPFFSPEPRTKEQQDRLDQFNDTIDDLRAGCGK